MNIKYWVVILSFLCVSLIHAETRLLQTSEAQVIHEDAEKVFQAILEHNFEYVVDRYPKRLLNIMGGREKAIDLAQSAVDMMQREKIKFLQFDINLPTEMISSGLYEVVLVPTEAVLQTPKGKVVSSSFLIASRMREDKTWSFFDAAGIKSREGMEAVFPQYPKDKPIPHVYHKFLN